MNDIFPKGLIAFLKKPDMPKLVCLVIAIFLAVLILRYFKVIEGMVNDYSTGNTNSDTEGYGGKHHKKKHSNNTSDNIENMLNPTKLMSKIGM